jgi:hypothetical protein
MSKPVLIPLPSQPLTFTGFIKVEPNTFLSKVMYFIGTGGITSKHNVLVRNDVFLKEVLPWVYDGKRTKFVLHEQKHHEQYLEHPYSHSIRYSLTWLKIYLFAPDKHPYFDHPQEIEAREAANQTNPYLWKEEVYSSWLPIKIGK